MWMVRAGDRDGWLRDCREAAFASDGLVDFRRRPGVTLVTETWLRDPERTKAATLYALTVMPRLRHWLHAVAEVDRVGGAYEDGAAEVRGHVLSGVAARSLMHAAQIERLFGRLDGFSVVEIGPGYGHLAAVLHALYSLSWYHACDLPDPTALQQRYLSIQAWRRPELYGKVTYEAMGDDGPGAPDLCLSAWSLSELDESGREAYADILRRSERWYHVWNEADYGSDGESDSVEVGLAWLRSLDGDREVSRCDDGTFGIAPPCRTFSSNRVLVSRRTA